MGKAPGAATRKKHLHRKPTSMAVPTGVPKLPRPCPVTSAPPIHLWMSIPKALNDGSCGCGGKQSCKPIRQCYPALQPNIQVSGRQPASVPAHWLHVYMSSSAFHDSTCLCALEKTPSDMIPVYMSGMTLCHVVNRNVCTDYTKWIDIHTHNRYVLFKIYIYIGFTNGTSPICWNIMFTNEDVTNILPMLSFVIPGPTF